MKKGDIILVPFPFTDLSGNKLRPALVLVEEGDAPRNHMFRRKILLILRLMVKSPNRKGIRKLSAGEKLSENVGQLAYYENSREEREGPRRKRENIYVSIRVNPCQDFHRLQARLAS